MRAMIVVASRYGSSLQSADWIAERLRLDGIETDLHRVQEAPPPDQADLVILGSGLYSHHVLPELEDYIQKHLLLLQQRAMGLFILAMRTTPVFVQGQSHGGLAQFDPLFKRLGPTLLHAQILGGELIFSRLTPEDAASIQRFYAMLKLSPAELADRQVPRTLLNKQEAWDFAEALLKQVRSRA